VSGSAAIRWGTAAASAGVFAAAAGWLPLRPAVAAGAIAALVLAGELVIELRARRAPAAPSGAREALVDTSALIDGRLVEIVATGFLDGDLLVPEFVLRELQHVADAPDPLRRARGRRGLEALQALSGGPRAAARVVGEDVAEETSVDLKLVALARRRGAALVTNDVALSKVAGIRDVRVLNVNALAKAVRPAALPGERLRVTIVKEGKEPGQGVAYLDDGTMIVVEQGRAHAGRSIDVVVTSAIQTSAGKMFFATIAEGPAQIV
jgi:uncharacterized protein YacL